jgi:hypothetical protein
MKTKKSAQIIKLQLPVQFTLSATLSVRERSRGGFGFRRALRLVAIKLGS